MSEVHIFKTSVIKLLINAHDREIEEIIRQLMELGILIDKEAESVCG